MSDTIHIALTFDDNYLEPAIVMMTSVLANKKEDETIVFHILDGGFSEESKKVINGLKNCDIAYHPVDAQMFEKYKKRQYYTVSVLWRLLLPNLVNVDKLIFLDCDLVVNHSLNEFWHTDVDGYYVAAVEDPNGKKYAKRFHLKKDSKFFNAGVLLINCKKWREDKIPELSLKKVMDNIESKYCNDQTTLNILFEGKVKFLDLKWNLQYCPFNIWPTYDDIKEYKSAIDKPMIIHYTGDFKPWKKGCGCFHPFQQKYFAYHKLTTFAYDNYENWYKADKRMWIKGLMAFIKRYPFFYLRKQYWKNFIYIIKVAGA
jgi:lipopolysaccharide biosynthesis glycosyltransferase